MPMLSWQISRNNDGEFQKKIQQLPSVRFLLGSLTCNKNHISVKIIKINQIRPSKAVQEGIFMYLCAES